MRVGLLGLLSVMGALAAGAPEREWPPPSGAGVFYGSGLTGWFGGESWIDTPFEPLQPDRPSLWSSRRGPRKLTISGSAAVNFSVNSISGAASTFSQDQYGKDQSFQQNASLLVSGPIWKAANLNVHAQVEQRSFGFNDTRPVWRVFWEDQNHRVTFGDISPSLKDANEFVPFSRRLQGLQAEGRVGRQWEYLAFGSQVGGSIRTETFVGDGTQGPYFLTFVPIIDGSAVVVVDGVIQQPGYGDTGDYTLNPSTGELLFNGARIIPSTSRIEVRYETLKGGGPADLLVGGELRWRPSRRWSVGFQYISQLAGGGELADGPTERRVTDQLTVPTPSSGPFTIRPRPIVVGSETVQVNGILQQRDVDYEIAYQTGELQFFQILPEGANILVRFSVIEAVDLGSGDRTIWGLNTGWTITENMALRLELAQSSGSAGTSANPYSFTGSGQYGTGLSGTGYTTGLEGLTGTGSTTGGNIFNTGGATGGNLFNSGTGGGVFRSRAAAAEGQRPVGLGATTTSRQTQAGRGGGGTALKVGYNARFGGFSLGAQYKQVSDNFSRIDSTGFYQNEQGLSFQTQYTSGPRLSLSYQFDHFTRPLLTATDDETASARVNSDLHLASLSWRFLPSSQLNFTHNQQSNTGGGSGTSLMRDSLTLSHSFSSQLQLSAGLDLAESGSSGVVGATGDSLTNNSRSFSGRVGLGYNTRGGRLGARVDYSFANTDSTTATQRASSILGSLNWRPFEILSLQFTHQLANSRNESLVGREWSGARPGTALWFLQQLERQRQIGVGVFEPGAGNTAVDPLTGQPLTTSTIVDNSSQNSSLTMLLTPLRRLTLSAGLTHTVTDNGRLAGSRSNSFQSNLHYQISDRIGLGVGYNLQSLKYTDTGDTTDTGIWNANFDWQLSNHLDLRFDWQRLGTSNKFGPRDPDEPDPTLGLSPTSTFGSLGADLRWRLPGRSGHALFWALRHDGNTGSSGDFSRLQMQTGMDFRLTNVVGLRLSYDFTDYTNKSDGSNSYLAHLFNAGLGARF